jgi:hypothetical protein
MPKTIAGNFLWKEMYKHTEPGINAEGVRVYPFDRSFPIDVSFHNVSGPRLVRLNRHEFLEIMYIYSGRTKIQVRDRILPTNAGDLVVVGPNLYHRILYKPNDDVRLVSMNFQPEIARSGKESGEEQYYLSPFLCQGSNFPHVITKSEKLPGEVFDHIVKIHRELPAATLLNRMAIRTYLKMILFLLFKYYAKHFWIAGVVGSGTKELATFAAGIRSSGKKFFSADHGGRCGEMLRDERVAFHALFQNDGRADVSLVFN